MLSEKIRTLRKQARMSQEQLAEKLNVSRQAVTKWETDIGVPDIENLKAISTLFDISLDELLGNQKHARAKQDFLFNSVTEYDIDDTKSYDITFEGAKQVIVTAYEGEKLQVRLASNQISDIQSLFKVKIDDERKKIDVDVHRFGSMTETGAKESLYIVFRFPQRYSKAIELAGNTEMLTVQDIEIEDFEFSGKTSRVRMNHVSGHVELNGNADMDILCGSLDGRLDINQISATSRLSLPAGLSFRAVTRGIANTILYKKDDVPTEDFSVMDTDETVENVIKLNGMKSELIINALSESAGLASDFGA